jgi:hypothetical protein
MARLAHVRLVNLVPLVGVVEADGAAPGERYPALVDEIR